MTAEILSLNVGLPQKMSWNGREIVSGMLKKAIPGPLVVNQLTVDGDGFANTKAHGTPDSVVYAFGMKSLMAYMALLGRDKYLPGALGENVTLDDFDEKQVSVGDVFKFGEVLLQATFPRIPCSKVDLRMEHPKGRELLVKCGRSGVYFRVIKPGKINMGDKVERVEEAKIKFSIFDVYAKAANNIALTDDERHRGLTNGAFPSNIVEKWRAHLKL